MPKKQNPLTPDEQRALFEAEVRKRNEAGDFDQGAAEAVLERLVKESRNLAK